MNKYEFVYIVDAHAPQGTKDDIAKQVADAAAKAEVKLVSSSIWLERHKMSFSIKKVSEATYYMVNLEGDAGAMAKLQTILRLNEQILRFLILKLEPKDISPAGVPTAAAQVG